MTAQPTLAGGEGEGWPVMCIRPISLYFIIVSVMKIVFEKGEGEKEKRRRTLQP